MIARNLDDSKIQHVAVAIGASVGAALFVVAFATHVSQEGWESFDNVGQAVAMLLVGTVMGGGLIGAMIGGLLGALIHRVARAMQDGDRARSAARPASGVNNRVTPSRGQQETLRQRTSDGAISAEANASFLGTVNPLYLGVASVLNQILLAHAANSAERARAVTLLAEMSDGELDSISARRCLHLAGDDFLLPPHLAAQLEIELRLSFLRLAVDIALVDDHVTPHERKLLHELAKHLLVPPAVLEHLLDMLTRDGSRDAHEAVRQACDVLGVKPDDDVSVIRTAHRRLIREHHPDRFPEHERAEATKRASEINAAYDLLIGAN